MIVLLAETVRSGEIVEGNPELRLLLDGIIDKRSETVSVFVEVVSLDIGMALPTVDKRLCEVRVVVGFIVKDCLVELGVLEMSRGKDSARLVLLYGMPLDTTCTILFDNKIAVATFTRAIPSLEFLLLTKVHVPFWNVKPEQSLVSEQISEQEAKSGVSKFEVMLLLAGKKVLQRI